MDRSAQTDRILTQQNANGGPFWSRDDGNIHAPNGTSTLLVLNVLGELGASVHLRPRQPQKTQCQPTQYPLDRTSPFR